MTPFLESLQPSSSLVQCIGEAFGVDTSNKTQKDRLSIKPATLQSIFDVYLKTTASARAPQPKESVPSSGDKARAEKHKQTGNQYMSKKDYDQAIENYNRAIELDGTNPVVRSFLWS